VSDAHIEKAKTIMLTIASITESIDQLKPVSDVAGKVLTLLEDPESGMSDLAEIIRHEPALTASILKLANSSYFGLPEKIDDPKQAIVYLGMEQIVDLVLLASCSEKLAGAHAGYGLSAGKLWERAVSGAILANDLALRAALTHSGLLFTGALLREIGKVVLNQYVQSAADAILDRVNSQGLSFKDAECQILGLDHTQVGAMLLKKRHFPPSLVCIVSGYLAPVQADGCEVEASIVYTADMICRDMGIGPGVDDASYSIDTTIVRSTGLSDADIQDVMDAFGDKMERVNALFATG
jgi:HD-like signal output (HDOD) protein